MAPTVNGVYTGSMVTTADPTVSLGATPASGDTLILGTFTGATTDPLVSAVSGCGATWTRIPGAQNYMTFWMGTGATSSGTITATAAASTNGRALRVYHLSGVQSHARFQRYFATWSMRCTENQIIIGAGYAHSTTAGTSITSTTPSPGWTDSTEVQMVATNRRFNTTHLIPHMASDCTVVADVYSAMLVVGSPTPGTTVVRVNPVINANNESTPDWQGSGFNTPTASTEQAFSGTKSAKRTANASAPEVWQVTGSSPMPAVLSGTTYTASGYVFCTTARNAAATIRWCDRTGTIISTDTGSTTAVPANTWTRVTVTATAPTTGTLPEFASVGIKMTDGISGDVCYFDAFLLEEGSSASAYWDGYSGDTYTFMGPTDEYPSIQTTAVPARVPVVHAVTTSALTTGADPTVTLADTPAAGDVLVLFTAKGATGDTSVTAVSGCGATWTKLAGGQQFMTFWMGTGATSSGTVTATGTATTNGRSIRLFHLKNVTADYFTQPHDPTYPIRASTNQIVIGAGYSQSATADTALSVKLPLTGWTSQTEVVHTATNRRSNTAYSVPVYNQGHNIQGTSGYGLLLVIGSPVAGMKVVRRNPVANSNLDRLKSTTTVSPTVGAEAISTAITPAFGIASLRVPTSGVNAEVYKSSGNPMHPVLAGNTYTISMYVYTPGSRSVALTMRWYSGVGSLISTDTSSTTTPTANTWTRLTYTVTAPSAIAWGAMGVKFTDSANLDVFYIDAWMINDGSTALDYFDALSTPPAGQTGLFLGPSDLYPSVQMAPVITKVWSRESGVWVDRSGAVPKAWNGTTWVAKRPKRWNGIAWVDLL